MIARLPLVAYWLACVALAWLLMQAVHEAGHVLGAWLTGGHVLRVVLHPLTISRTDVAPNPNPVFEICAGPLFGAAFPVAVWLIGRALRPASAPWWRFFAGFCLIANGCYIGYGVFEPIGDAEELARLGVWRAWFGLFGLSASGMGLRLWHGLGREFGLGSEAKPISWQTAAWTFAALAIIVALEIAHGMSH
jgi:hypothetical protein